MKHLFNKGSKDRTLLLLHGTGGNEFDMLSLAKIIDSDANVLSVRGSILENGMSRYFKRLSEGIFDEEDLIERTNELNAFIKEASIKYDFNRADVVAIGYSNGANIAGNLLFQIANSLKGAILFHPMVPRRGVVIPDLTDVSVFIGAGTNDPLTSLDETNELTAMLSDASASVELHLGNSGHSLSNEELQSAVNWYQRKLS
jgi:phospholipase/carboxylesterase